ncbi:MAG: S8 family serine peptidase, partial [bacterium]
MIFLLSLAVLAFIPLAALKPGDSRPTNSVTNKLHKSQNIASRLNLQNNSASFSQQSNYMGGKVIVKLKSTPPLVYSNENSQKFFTVNSLTAKARKFGITKVDKVFPMERPPSAPDRTDLSTIYELTFDPSMDPGRVARAYASDANVEYAEPRYVYDLTFVPNDSLYTQQSYLSLINAEMAWDITKGSRDVVIGIVDDGVDWRHPDIVRNIWQNLGEDADGDGHTIEFNGSYWDFDPGDLNGIDDDDLDGVPTSFIDDLIGWDFVPGDHDPTSSMDHGTHVAGLASAATNNFTGIAGVGFNCRILPVKGSDDGTGITFGFEGIKYAVDAGVDIINCSWGGPLFSDFGLDIVNYAHEHDVVLVAAAGNSDADLVFYPAAYPYVMSVAATNSNDQKANFSNYGFGIDVSAPGVSLLSTVLNGSYGTKSGTSMASPVAAGVAALVKSFHPQWSGDQIREQVRVSSDDISSLNSTYEKKLGHGRVNAFNALTKVSPAICVLNSLFSDVAQGDGDGIVEPGEIIQLSMTLKNYLEPAADVHISLSTDDSNIIFTKSTYTIANLASGQSVEINSNALEFQVGNGASFGHKVDFILDIEANGGTYRDWDSFSLIIDPLYRDHDAGNVILTLTSFGALGFYDYAESGVNLGNGFKFPKNSASTLFHGSLMVGTDPSHVSDASYGDIFQSHYDWRTVSDGNINIDEDALGNQIGLAKYNDIQAPEPIGVVITQKSYAYKNPPDDDLIILEYTIQNTKGMLIDNLYTALYLDWDINNSLDDEVGFNNALNLGYM